MPRVSAIVVTHNRVGELPGAIRSVLEQTYADIELIVVNDASEDGTKEYLDRLDADGRARVVNLETSGGAAGARNLGVSVSTGELIAFLDDDDRWHPTKIAEQVPLFDASDGVGAVYCAQRMVFDRVKYVDTKPTYRGFVGADIFTTMLGTSSAMMYSRRGFDEVGGFDVNLTHWQDLELNLRIAQAFPIDFVPHPLVDVFVNTQARDRLSNQFEAWLPAVRYIRRKHAAEIRQLTDRQKKKFDAMCVQDGLNRLYNSGQRGRWWKNLLAYFLRHPSPGGLLQLITGHDQLSLWRPLLPAYHGSD